MITSLCATFLTAFVLPHAPYLKLIAFLVVIATSGYQEPVYMRAWPLLVATTMLPV